MWDVYVRDALVVTGAPGLSFGAEAADPGRDGAGSVGAWLGGSTAREAESGRRVELGTRWPPDVPSGETGRCSPSVPKRRVRSFIGSVAVKDGRIAAVFEGAAHAEPARLAVDGVGKMLIPGLFNAHLHCDVTLLRGLGDGMTLHDQIYGPEIGGRGWFREALDDEMLALSREVAYVEALRGGTTFVCDNAFWSLGPQAPRIMRRVGLRGAIVEDIRPDFRRPSEFRRADAMKPLFDAFRGAGVVPVIGGPAEEDYSVEVLRAVRDASVELGALVHLHLAETDWRVELAERKFGKRPAALLQEFGLASDRLIAAHCVHLTSNEMRGLAARGASLVSAPTAEAKIADGLAPVARLVGSGANVAIGSDGALWNNSSDMFREMKAFCLAGALDGGPKSVSEEDAFIAATMGGARTFGLERELGTIQEGKKADLALVSLEGPHMVPVYFHRPLSNLVFCAVAADVEAVFVEGNPVVWRGSIATVDVSGLLRHAREAALELAKELRIGSRKNGYHEKSLPTGT